MQDNFRGSKTQFQLKYTFVGHNPNFPFILKAFLFIYLIYLTSL